MKKVKKYVKDKEVLDRIGLDKDSMYAEYTFLNKNDNACDLTEEEILSLIEEDDRDYTLIDNSNCDADFEDITPGYNGTKNYMHGDIRVYKKTQDMEYSVLKGIYSADGLYKMDSGVSTVGYLGKEGRARGISIPQCKFMNSTIFDDIAEHKIYIGKYNCNIMNRNQIDLGKSGLDWKDENKVYEWLINNNIDILEKDINNKHISFDVWCIVGVIFDKAKVAWRICNRDMNKMPKYMTIHITEIYEALNPGCKWKDLSNISKHEWRENICKVFSFLNYDMIYDLPQEDRSRMAYCSNCILWNSIIKKRAIGKAEEQRCIKEWGEVWEPFAYKVKLKGAPLFDFCWRNKKNSPSLVQIRMYDYDCKKIFNTTKNNNLCFQAIYAAWLIQYRNYWVKRDKTFKSCKLIWSQKEMLQAFRNSIFNIKHLSTDEMETIMGWYSVGGVFNGKIKRPAHIGSYDVLKRCEISWTLPESLDGESVILKNENGINISIKESGITNISDEVKFAASRINFINEENNKHKVTLDNKSINTNESVIYRMSEDHGIRKIMDDIHGRCYSMKDGIQGLKKEDRKRVYIDGNEVNEVDYESLHPNMLYALNGVSYNGKSMYDVGRKWYRGFLKAEEARTAVKMMLLRMINAKNKSHAIHSFKKEWNIMHGYRKNAYIPWLYNLYDAILSHHKLISHEFCTGKGIYLMNLDGKLIREVCWRLTREKICTLAIHDSVVVDMRYVNRAEEVMKEEYEKMFTGNTINIKIK